MRISLIVVSIWLALVPGVALAEGPNRDGDTLIRIRGDVVLAADESVDTLVVVDGDALIRGTVNHNVVVVNGNAIVEGVIKDNLTVVSGDITLRKGARLDNVTAIRGSIQREDGVTVTGKVRERSSFGFLRVTGVIFSLLFWVAMSVAVLAAGAVFALVGRKQLVEAADAMTAQPVNVILGAVFVWVAIPVVAVLAMITLIGFVFGVGLLVFLLPTLWFLGYIVAGSRLGLAILTATKRESRTSVMLTTLLGLTILQLLVLIPVLGALVSIIAAIWGAGSLGYVAFRAAGGKGLNGPQETTAVQPV